VMVLGSGDQAAGYPAGSAGSFAGYGVNRAVRLPGSEGDVGGLTALPLPLAVGAWLLEAAGWSGDTVGATCDAAGRLAEISGLDRTPTADGNSVGLLVMGDGSARRSEKAPGWLDDRSQAYDAAVSAALASGDPDRLAVDLAISAELLAAGAPAWTATAGLLRGTGSWSSRVSYDDAPYGVGYLVATWFRAPAR
jgi:hypothetical protein